MPQLLCRSATRVLSASLAAMLGASLLAGCSLIGGSGGSGTAAPTKDCSPAPGPQRVTSSYVRGVYYFGDASPINFWSSDLSGAAKTFAQMQADGFNTVALVIPWGHFQLGVQPPRYDMAAFCSLRQLVSIAGHHHLQVILRLSYQDMDPRDQMAGSARVSRLFSDSAVRRSWLDYIGKVHQQVSGYPNVRGAFLSWEDYWFLVNEAQVAHGQARLRLARATGYQGWLRHHYSLSQVDSIYPGRFSSWSAVPTPNYHTPAFKLFYRYFDWFLKNRLFQPAERKFPGLSLEARVDADPIYQGNRIIGTYSHSSTWHLPGTSVTGLYFNPYMGVSTSGSSETASQGLQGLQNVLSAMKSGAEGRPLFIYEYQFVSNAPQISGTPTLAPDQVPIFIEQSGALLRKYTVGYAVWTYRDFPVTVVFNPSFSLGTEAWATTGSVSVAHPRNASSYLELPGGGSAAQAIPGGRNAYPGSGRMTLSLRAAAPDKASDLKAKVGVRGQHTFHVVPGWHSYSYTFSIPRTGLRNYNLTLQTSAPTNLTAVKLYSFVQLGDVHSLSGSPEPGLTALRNLNSQLANAPGPPTK
jgi:hypothetical protein